MSEKFKFVKSIGKGAFGDVYLCEKKSNNQNVVIKVTHNTENDQQEFQSMESEAKCHAQFKHPNILQYYESFLENDSLFIVMEYAAGGNLYDYLQSRKKTNFLPEEDVLGYFCQLVAGLKHIHERNILHRDLKSHNIMLDSTRKVVKIGDFGISKPLESQSKALTVVGTTCYFSPEVVRERPYNKKSDIWALGCILFEMLSLNRAFDAKGLLPLVNKIKKGKIDPLPEIYSEAIKNLVHSMLDINQDTRPSIDQINSNPLVFPKLLQIMCDFGRVSSMPEIKPLSDVTYKVSK